MALPTTLRACLGTPLAYRVILPASRAPISTEFCYLKHACDLDHIMQLLVL